MNIHDWLQLIVYIAILLALAKPLGTFMARVYQGERTFLDPLLRPVERLLYRAAGVRADEEMSWKVYAVATMLFNGLGLLAVYALQRLQGALPLNPQGLGAVTPDSSWNTAVSFATNTNWQGYGGETTMSYLTQMLALTVQNFASAATGMVVLVALIRGITRHTAQTIGNFWVDLTRTTLYILLPLSVILALALVSQGVVQNWWRQGMMGGAKAHYDSIKAFSETDFTEDLKVIDVPTLVMHGDDDQIVPIADSALLSVKLLKNGTLKVYKGFPHGMCTTHADVINPDLLAFIKG